MNRAKLPILGGFMLSTLIIGCTSEKETVIEGSATVEQTQEVSLKAAETPAPISVIFDTDMAIDDWSALLFLQRHPQIDLLALTIAGSGESHCEPGTKNALALLDISLPGSEVPVACGDSWPLDGYFVFPVPWQEDMDKLSGVPVTPSKREPFEGHAVELIHEQIQASEEPVVLLVTGPMTNLAQWLEKYPEDKEKVSRVVLMGGALHAPGNIIVPGFTDDNPNKDAEWNFYIDPPATQIVLESDLPIELVGLDVTNHVLVTSEFADYFKSVVDNPSAAFWDGVLDANDWFIDSNEYYFWDVLAALVVTDRDTFCKGEYMDLTSGNKLAETPWLPTSDMTIPNTNWKGEARQHLDAETAGVVLVDDATESAKNSLVCLETDSKKAFDVFVKTLIDAEDLPPQPEYRKPQHLIDAALSEKTHDQAETNMEAHLEHPYVFHLVQISLWDKAVKAGETYYPPTYEADGFTHATANPEYLLTIGNHFYKETKGDWALLKMTVESLKQTGVETIFEGTAPVGDKQADFDGSESELFPHILGGIKADAVLEILSVSRAEDGEFLSIQGLDSI